MNPHQLKRSILSSALAGLLALPAALLTGCGEPDAVAADAKPGTAKSKPAGVQEKPAAGAKGKPSGADKRAGGRTGDWVMWGGANDRNMISLEKNPPTKWAVA